MKLTLKSSRSTRHQCAGLGLLETVVSTGLAMMLATVVVYISMFTARSFQATSNYAELDNRSRKSLDMMSYKIRQSSEIMYYVTNASYKKLAVTNFLTGKTNLFFYDMTTNGLTMTEDGITQELLRECDYLNFALYKGAVTNNFQFYAAGTNTALLKRAKLIDLNWKCSRQIRGVKVNTESVQTAKIVIRN